MSVSIVPIASRKIRPDLIIPFRGLQDSHVEICDCHSLGVTSQPRKRSGIWDTDLGEACIAFTWWTAGVGECDGYGGCQRQKAIASTGHTPQVFSKHLAGIIESKNSASATGLIANPSFEQSLNVQNVGTIINFAPCVMSSRKASGNPRSQHISIPTLPSGVLKTG